MGVRVLWEARVLCLEVLGVELGQAEGLARPRMKGWSVAWSLLLLFVLCCQPPGVPGEGSM